MKLVTGNDLVSGDVIWWAGHGWSRHISDAADAGDEGEAIAAREEAARRVNGPYLIEADAGQNGPLVRNAKERIRAAGPSVRPDLGVQAEKQGVA
ncbi:DUF2849 domain-containing protein [Sphingomonas sp.]|uniref:DUF2849 domain-containing protein n=1 Tax=Sphingomonas sp. TaxID=28214 RepID=UPI000DB659B6|nr:DUF2849 domain-containing protein [Sphingomonas sp.]PZU09693.1 MAG: DUF2849 domain-containing protein [Sphingomonas sp.]